MPEKTLEGARVAILATDGVQRAEWRDPDRAGESKGLPGEPQKRETSRRLMNGFRQGTVELVPSAAEGTVPKSAGKSGGLNP